MSTINLYDPAFYKKALNQYFDVELTEVKALNKKSVDLQHGSFVMLHRYFEQELEIKDVDINLSLLTIDNIKKFKEWYENTRNVTQSTISMRLTHIKGFAQFLNNNFTELSDELIALCDFDISKINTTKCNHLTPEQIDTIIAQIDDTTPQGFSHKLTILLLYESGALVSEICNLKMFDIVETDNNDHVQIALHGKGNRTRIIDLNGQVAKMIIQQLAINKGYEPDDPLLKNPNSNEKITSKLLQNVVSTYSKKAHEVDHTIPENINPSIFRQSRAVQLYKEHMPVYSLIKFLGSCTLVTGIVNDKNIKI